MSYLRGIGLIASICLIIFDEFKALTLVAGFICFSFLFLRPYFTRLNYRKQFRKRPDKDIDMEWNISFDIIHCKSALGSSEFVWSAIKKLVITPEGILMYVNDQIFNWLPYTGFSSDSDIGAFEEIAREHVPDITKNCLTSRCTQPLDTVLHLFFVLNRFL